MKVPEVSLQGPLVRGRFLTRANRFLLQVRLEDTDLPVDVHMADPGRLEELLVPGRIIWLRRAAKPDRKTQWTAVMVEAPDGRELVSIDTTLPNRLIKNALEEKALEEVRGWDLERAEVPIGRSRLDFVLARADGARMALEVKSVTLVEEGVGLFPDAVTARGARHVRELAKLAGSPGWEAAILFVLQRSDAQCIRAAAAIDPVFAEAVKAAKKAGVHVFGRRCRVLLDRVELGERVPAGDG